jgi:hypothetical protein
VAGRQHPSRSCARVSALAVSALAATALETSALADAPAAFEIDATPAATIAHARRTEGDAGPAPLVFTVRLSGPPHGYAAVTFATEDGTATVGNGDYDAAAGKLTFGPTDTLGTIQVAIRGDPYIEGNEWFILRLSDPEGFALAESVAFGIITNDERPTFVRRNLARTDYDDGTLPTAWADFNLDGYPDLPVFTGDGGGGFFETPGFRPLLAEGNYHGAASCDYDRDGDPDLVILGYTLDERLTPNVLLRNQGDGTFTNVAPLLGMSVSGNGETAVWGDFDGDGWPDLFAPFYTDVHPWQSFLYMNNGDGTFTDRAIDAGVSLIGVPWNLRAEGAHGADWNDDGHLDLYCASHLFINDGTGHFTDVRESVGLPQTFDEGSSFVDYDNDGDLDLYLRCIGSPRLFRNDAGAFTEVTQSAGITGVPLFWGDSWADADNDGDMDLIQHGGPARLLLNRGDGTFERDPGFESITSTQELSAWADVDLDGDLDVVIGPFGKELYLNQLQYRPGFARSCLRVRVLDADGHETAHGATVRLRELRGGPGSVQTRIVDGGSGYLSQNEYVVHFGGTGSGRYALDVVYPSPVGSRVVVDSLVHPGLGSLEPWQYLNGLITIYRDGRVEFPGPNVAAVPVSTAADGAGRLLGAPTPAPARRSATVSLAVPRAARVALAIHDVRGRAVRTLEPGALAPGRHDLVWDLADGGGAAVPNGVYFCRLLLDGVPADRRRLLVLR